ncbi:MAG: 5-(carboxyamino)imidazole ribonucleotide synthase [Bacteroidetes bacterium]|nr:MAG: 5-(carboxyamino)imidazole ribonucleotide synthase [Bacteroidota bacterium]REK32224.1 MAG: 5-(carboxyamino)imidazole ribonucleotide synthase [Bacteroidota bacterium]REK47376.1 MAG: 5-(carboxyamino)imidazole ribonucleotide synthase [Bacteroidota bacterium]
MSQTTAFKSVKLGILGGGQLGKMLLQKAADYDLETSVLDPDPLAPCRNLCDHFEQGSFKDYDAVYNFGKKQDVLTIEIEHVNIQALEDLEKEGTKVRPEPAVIKLIQDKGSQKIFFRANKIPTAEFHLVDNADQIRENTSFFPCMQKLRKGGYDGRGVKRIMNSADSQSAFDEPSVIERMIDFKSELSVIVARDSRGNTRTFPSVQMHFDPNANLVDYLFSPAETEQNIEEEATVIAVNLANALKITGVLAVEMFLTRSGELLVNEIAPRPHNSGHHTIEANYSSQYDQHLRAILDLPLGSCALRQHAFMLNILGDPQTAGPAVYEGVHETLSMEGVYIHLYGKKESRPNRKMGHVTVLASSAEEAKKKMEQVRRFLKVRTRS